MGEKLPEYVEEALNVFQDASTDKGGFMGPVGFDDAVRKMFMSKVALRDAVHRYAREREAAALEMSAKACDYLAPFEATGGGPHYTALDCARAIRSMGQKGTANG